MNNLHQLYEGNLVPEDVCLQDRKEEYYKNLNLIEKNKKLLSPTLSKEQKHQLKQIIRAGENVEEILSEGAFRTGFALGVSLLLEAHTIPLN